MSHVAPHRWADAAVGRVTAEERARMARHAAACRRCATARDRVFGARAAFGEIADAAPPEPRWEQLGAKIYWTASQERAARRRQTAERPAWRRRRAWVWGPALVAGAGIAAAAIVLAIPRASGPAPEVAAHGPVPAAPEVGDVLPVELVDLGPAPIPVIGLVTLAEGDARAAFDAPVLAGQVLETGAGRLAVQLDAGTAFALGPSSRATLARLDRAAIELHVEGEVSVEVARRAEGQRFAVVAGGRVVEVRGTAFEVSHRDGALSVRVRHGVVAVHEGDHARAVEIPAGLTWQARDADPLLARAPAPLDDAALTSLTARAPARLPAWTEPAALLRTTGPVQIAAPVGRAVRIDGEPVGAGALTVRLMSGRHLVEVERSPGRFGPGAWVSAGAPGAPARVEVPVEADPADDRAARRAAIQLRRRQLDRGVDQGRLRGCVNHLAKQGMASGTHVDLHVEVDDTGAIGALNLGDTDLSADTAGCIRDAVAAVRFPAGPAARWIHRISF